MFTCMVMHNSLCFARLVTSRAQPCRAEFGRDQVKQRPLKYARAGKTDVLLVEKSLSEKVKLSDSSKS